ncbi:deoxycytidine kinase [Haematococcus lacustris]|uniref:Deoxycytidine kinase n=2 Tax=Haematococcus lacustris TaxID=44745 RepID=A0A6A0AGY0_HAELA|nr:deoxycytidine kinase [Haematococcus lacustris]
MRMVQSSWVPLFVSATARDPFKPTNLQRLPRPAKQLPAKRRRVTHPYTGCVVPASGGKEGSGAAANASPAGSRQVCVAVQFNHLSAAARKRAAATHMASAPTLPGGGWPQPKVTLSVEGNISAGKSTFLRIIQNAASLQAKLQVVPEPVDKWQDVGQQHVNLLGEFYKDPHRFAYTFQNYVFLTRVVQERDSYVQPAPCRVLERSVFSDRMVFVRAGHAAGYITDTELSIYDAWFDPVLTTLPTLVPHAFIYLRAQELHGRHEDWLYQGGHEVRSQGSGAPLHLWASSSPATPHHIAPHVVAGNGSSHVSNSNGCRGSSQEACQGNGSSPASTQPTGLPLTAPQQPPSGDSAQQVGDIHPPSSQPTPQGGPQHPGLAIKLHAPFFSVHGHAVAAQLAQQHGWVSEPLPELPASLQGWVRFLDVSGKPHMHPLLHMRPALIIDCDADVDVHNDLQFQTSLAKMVSTR